MDDEKLIDKWKKETSKHEGAWSNKSLYRIIKMTREDEQEKKENTPIQNAFIKRVMQENLEMRKGIEEVILFLKKPYFDVSTILQTENKLKKLLGKGD